MSLSAHLVKALSLSWDLVAAKRTGKALSTFSQETRSRECLLCESHYFLNPNRCLHNPCNSALVGAKAKPSRSSLGFFPMLSSRMAGAGPENLSLCHTALREVNLSLSETWVRVSIAQIFLSGFSKRGIHCHVLSMLCSFFCFYFFFMTSL